MSGPATHPNTPNKETSSGKGQRREIYYGAQAHHRKRQRKHFSHVCLSTGMSLRFKWRKNCNGGEVCIIKQSRAKCGLVARHLSSGSARGFKEAVISVFT
jgi:hypothetical protein